MHHVEAPEGLHEVECHVLSVDEKVEKDHGGSVLEKRGQGDIVEKAETSISGIESGADSRHGKEESEEESIEKGDCYIVRPTPGLR
jgi:hypothetical protein